MKTTLLRHLEMKGRTNEKNSLKRTKGLRGSEKFLFDLKKKDLNMFMG